MGPVLHWSCSSSHYLCVSINMNDTFRKQHFNKLFPILQLLYSFYLSSGMLSEPGGSDIGVPFRAEHVKVSFSDLDKLQVSVLIYCKKNLLWWCLSKAVIYKYSRCGIRYKFHLMEIILSQIRYWLVTVKICTMIELVYLESRMSLWIKGFIAGLCLIFFVASRVPSTI